MTKIEIYETGTTVEIPSSWDEMTTRQVRDVMKIYTRCVESQSSPLEFNVRVLYYLMGMKHNARSVRWERLADADSVRQRDCDHLPRFGKTFPLYGLKIGRQHRPGAL